MEVIVENDIEDDDALFPYLNQSDHHSSDDYVSVADHLAFLDAISDLNEDRTAEEKRDIYGESRRHDSSCVKETKVYKKIAKKCQRLYRRNRCLI